MIPYYLVCILTVCFNLATVGAEEPNRGIGFQFASGQTLNFKVDVHTRIANTVLGEQAEEPAETSLSSTTMSAVKSWTVGEVDSQGTALLHLTLTSLKVVSKLPNGTELRFDSAMPDTSTDFGKQLAGYVGKPMLTIQVDTTGKVVTVVENKFGMFNRTDGDLPFRAFFPAVTVTTGAAWQRDFSVKLDPPFGVGETYAFVQQFTCKNIEKDSVTLALQTELKFPPTTPSEMIPLLPYLFSGEIRFDAAKGRYLGSKLSISKELPNYLGAGSKYVFQSTFIEEAISP